LADTILKKSFPVAEIPFTWDKTPILKSGRKKSNRQTKFQNIAHNYGQR
jgi:hypothetical protein